MSAFTDAMAKAAPAFYGALGENLQFTPMLGQGRYKGSAPDAGRPVFVIVGTFLEAPHTLRMNDNVVGRDFNSQIAENTAFAFIRAADLGTTDLRVGDQVSRIDQPGAPVFEINVPPDSNGAGGLILRMVRK